MTAPITSNGPITTRLHHYAGRYSYFLRYHQNQGVSMSYLEAYLYFTVLIL